MKKGRVPQALRLAQGARRLAGRIRPGPTTLDQPNASETGCDHSPRILRDICEEEPTGTVIIDYEDGVSEDSHHRGESGRRLTPACAVLLLDLATYGHASSCYELAQALAYPTVSGIQ